MSSEPPDSLAFEQELWRVFDQLVDLEGEARAERLAAIGTESDRLRREVEKLLEADRSSAGALDQHALDLLSEEELLSTGLAGRGLADGSAQEWPSVVGDYRLLEEIGSGGMGTVFAAVRLDGRLDRPVAIKFLNVPRHSGAEAALERFYDEGKALAGLRHPHVARVYDIGALPALEQSGFDRPYLVMERVDGVALTEFCAASSLELEERVDLMILVCRAVQAAHDSRVVHRDLKPSNILVDDSGAPKLLDFGIARFLDRGVASAQGPLPLTPSYAAPEQIRGHAITEKTDVYALGLILYEVLTGQRVYDPSFVSVGELLANILETDPLAPSQLFGREASPLASSPLSRLQSRLAGDLDNIVMKALRKKPERRYASALALAEDLERFRAGRPVSARATGPLERGAKFVRRHRLATLAMAAVLMLLVGANALLQWQRHQAEARHALAVAETAQAQEISELVQWLFEASSPAEALGVDAPALDLLRSGIERVESMQSVGARAQLLNVLAGAMAELGHAEEAGDLRARASELSEPGASLAEGVEQ